MATRRDTSSEMTGVSRPAVPVPALPSRVGYAQVAADYDSWHWCDFWRRNEAPLLRKWFGDLPRGAGLDVGSGTGMYTPELAHFGDPVVAVDNCYEMLLTQMAKFAGPARKTLCPLWAMADVRDLPFRTAYFGWVLAARVLSHVERLDAAFAEISRVLRPGGVFLLSDIHIEHPNRATTVRIRGRTVAIEQFKHSTSAVCETAAAHGLRMAELREFRLADVTWAPPAESFGRVYDKPGHKIFFCCRLVRQAGQRTARH